MASRPAILIVTSPRTCQRTPEEQIGFLLKRLMHQFRHLVDERLRRGSDLSFAHLVTLDQLQQEPGVAGARLARSLLVTAQTMTGLLRRLERLNSARGAGAPVMTQMLSRLSAEEAAELRGYLERCVEGLETDVRRESAEPPHRSAATRSA